MNDNVVALSASLNVPDMDKILSVVSAYSAFWEQRRFGFLPLLHESVERHYKGMQRYVDGLAKNSEVLAVTIKSYQLDELIDDFREASGDLKKRSSSWRNCRSQKIRSLQNWMSWSLG